jgi:hypothetical protein
MAPAWPIGMPPASFNLAPVNARVQFRDQSGNEPCDAALMPRDGFRSSARVRLYANLLISLVPTRRFELRTY